MDFEDGRSDQRVKDEEGSLNPSEDPCEWPGDEYQKRRLEPYGNKEDIDNILFHTVGYMVKGP